MSQLCTLVGECQVVPPVRIRTARTFKLLVWKKTGNAQSPTIKYWLLFSLTFRSINFYEAFEKRPPLRTISKFLGIFAKDFIASKMWAVLFWFLWRDLNFSWTNFRTRMVFKFSHEFWSTRNVIKQLLDLFWFEFANGGLQRKSSDIPLPRYCEQHCETSNTILEESKKLIKRFPEANLKLFEYLHSVQMT